MKKYSDKSLNVTRFNPQSLNIARPQVRYVGFEGTNGGRRLRFAVKSVGRKSVEITIEISDAAFMAGSGVSIQDAAPMAYEKIVELLSKEDTLQPSELCLTDADIERYVDRHASSQKPAHSMMDRRHRSAEAA